MALTLTPFGIATSSSMTFGIARTIIKTFSIMTFGIARIIAKTFSITTVDRDY